MKPLAVIGIILILVGIVALAVPGFTYFTTEHVADTRFFSIDAQRPHTIIFNPIVGVVSVVAGIALVAMGRRSSSV